MSEHALQKYEPGAVVVALDATGRRAAIDELMNKVALVMETMERVMKKDTHYGTIPGTGNKMTLLKAGAEKLSMTFKLKPEFAVMEKELSSGHREYRVTCSLSDGSQGVGTCSTMETKYRWRWDGQGRDRKRVENEDIANCWNTCLKVAKKRAFVDAIITATACSDIFTQDVEDMIEAADATGNDKPASTPPKVAPVKQSAPERPVAPARANPAPAATAEQWKDYLLKQIAAKKQEIFAWKLFIDRGWVAQGASLSTLDASKVPQNNVDCANLMGDIRGVMDGFPQGVPQELDEQYTQAHLEELGPQEVKPPEPAWKSHELHYGPQKGTPLGKIDQKKLYGWWANYEPKPYKGKISPADAKLREMLDAAGDYMGFGEDEGRKKEQTAEPEDNSPGKGPDGDDDVPF